jgi:hypothetical protein
MARTIKNRWTKIRGSKRSKVVMSNKSKSARYARKEAHYTKSGKLKAVKYFKTAKQKTASKTFNISRKR